MHSNHTEQNFKICSKEFKTSIEVVIHVAKEHRKKEETCSSTPQSDKQGNQSGFVCSELMSDEFLLLVKKQFITLD